MAAKGQKFKKHSDEFKEFIVNLRIKKLYGIQRLSRIYQISSENVVRWTRRYLAGEPLTMKRGKKPGSNYTVEEQTLIQKLMAENEHLRMELAYNKEVLKLLEKREELKKKNDSGSLEN